MPESEVETVDCDFLIVGAGSSGCVLASRLVRQGLQVLLVENGTTDDGKLAKLVYRPSQWMAGAFSGNGVAEVFFTEPQVGLGGRRLHAFRGQGGGGTSNVNAGLYCRGRCVLKRQTLTINMLYTLYVPVSHNWNHAYWCMWLMDGWQESFLALLAAQLLMTVALLL